VDETTAGHDGALLETLAERKSANGHDGPVPALHPRQLIGLQALAGNAAVAGLIERSRAPTQPRRALGPAAPVAAHAPPATAPLTEVSRQEPAADAAIGEASVPATENAPPEPAASGPPPGESDDDLAALDAAADAPPEGETSAEEERAAVATEARAEVSEPDRSAGPEPAESGGAAEPGIPIEARPAPEVPDLNGSDPAADLARVAAVPPAKLLHSLGAVVSSADREAQREQARLAAEPPQRARHPGAPATVEEPGSAHTAMPEPAPAPLPRPAEAADVEVKPGPSPRLPLEGNADPASVHQHRTLLSSALEREHTVGRQAAAQPLGEDQIYPSVPAETLRAAVSAATGSRGEAPAAPLADEDEAASIIAQQEKGGEIQNAVGLGLNAIANQREEYSQRTAGERAKADTEMAQLEEQNSREQAGERAGAKREVLGLRQQWSGAQQELVAGAQQEADAKSAETLATVATERSAAEHQAATHLEQGQQEAARTRREGEQQAAAEQRKSQGQSGGGILGAIGSAAQSVFDTAKHAVQSVFDKVSQLVRSAIERAQQLATAVLERARQTIVAVIKTAGTALLAIGDRVLTALPALRDRFRRAIRDRIAAAEAVVNRLAGVLKVAVQNSLNLLGAALSQAIQLMRRGMQAAIRGVRSTVRGALDFARGAIAAFGTFAVLVKDIAANPGRWIANLAAAVKDGLQNYLWPEIKSAVQSWFTDKVQEVVGVGQAIWHLLQRGGISFADVARMAWEALKAALPGILIALLVEKLMSLIVPAVGAILTIIQSIQAAWASLGRILKAFETFFAFLKQVKLGTAGPLFAKAVAAGAIAAVEFVSNFLLSRLKGAATSVSNRLRAIAHRIGQGLARIGRRVMKGVRAAGRGLRRLGQKVRSGVDRLRNRDRRSSAERERAKQQREAAAFSATKARLDALFAKGVSRLRLAREVSILRIRYRWGSLAVQGPADARRVDIVGGFSPRRHVASGPVSATESLEALIGEDLIAQTKLRFVKRDPFIDTTLKADFMRKLETLLREARTKKKSVSPYEMMKQVVTANIDRYRLLGTPISPDQLKRMGGLSRVISLTHVWDNYLTNEYRLDFGLRESWIAAIRQDRSKFDPKRHLRPDVEISGSNGIGFWYARYRSAGTTTSEYVSRLQLTPARYPLGALKFEMRSVRNNIQFLRPTAFDGMPHIEWAPALRRDAVWGIVPGVEPKIREAVSGPVPISAITHFDVILP
jgi:hypothetical protein